MRALRAARRGLRRADVPADAHGLRGRPGLSSPPTSSSCSAWRATTGRRPSPERVRADPHRRTPRDGVVRRLPGLGDPAAARPARRLAGRGRAVRGHGASTGTPTPRPGPTTTRVRQRCWQPGRPARPGRRRWRRPGTNRYATGACPGPPPTDAQDALGPVRPGRDAHGGPPPGARAAPVPGAQRPTALRAATSRAPGSRERRVPQWDAVRAALAAWDGGRVPDRVVRRGAGLLLAALEEVSEAVEESPPFAAPSPRTVAGRAAVRSGRASPVGRPDGRSWGARAGRRQLARVDTGEGVLARRPPRRPQGLAVGAQLGLAPAAVPSLPSAQLRASAWSWKVARAGRLADGGGLVAGDREEVRPAVRPWPARRRRRNRARRSRPPVPPWSSSPASRAVAAALGLPVPEPELSPSLPQPVSEQGGRRGGGGDPERFPHVTYSPWWAV